MKAATKAPKSAKSKSRFAIVRTYSAGVHVGEVVARTDATITLRNARRVHRWRGANSLHEMSLRGVDETYSRISEPVAEIVLAEWIEVIACEKAAQLNLLRSRWGA